MWRIPPHPLDLPANAVHVWRVDLRVSPDNVQRLAGTLSRAERARAARFRFPEHRRRFIAAHGALRDILSRYLNVSARNIINGNESLELIGLTAMNFASRSEHLFAIGFNYHL